MTAKTAFGLLLEEFRAGPREAWEELQEDLLEYSPDELDVLGWVAARLTVGRARYGPLTLSGDPRRWLQERAEEAADILVYSAMAELVGRQVSPNASQRSSFRLVRPDDVDPPGRGAPR